MIGGSFQLPGIPAGEYTGSGWGAFGIGGIGTGEQNALPGHPVEGGSFYPVATICPGMGKRLVVGNTEEDIRAEECFLLFNLTAC